MILVRDVLETGTWAKVECLCILDEFQTQNFSGNHCLDRILSLLRHFCFYSSCSFCNGGKELLMAKDINFFFFLVFLSSKLLRAWNSIISVKRWKEISYLFFFIDKLHLHLVVFKPTTSPSTHSCGRRKYHVSQISLAGN